jgi:hypothetical protein
VYKSSGKSAPKNKTTTANNNQQRCHTAEIVGLNHSMKTGQDQRPTASCAARAAQTPCALNARALAGNICSSSFRLLSLKFRSLRNTRGGSVAEQFSFEFSQKELVGEQRRRFKLFTTNPDDARYYWQQKDRARFPVAQSMLPYEIIRFALLRLRCPVN